MTCYNFNIKRCILYFLWGSFEVQVQVYWYVYKKTTQVHSLYNEKHILWLPLPEQTGNKKLNI